jgi:solute carrier family 27 fatty acid transporter 1/4
VPYLIEFVVNIEGHVGACGYFPLYYYRFMPLYLAKVDEVTGEVIRDPKTGLVMHADIGQPGELMGKITQSNPFREFSGYTDPESTKKKLIQNVKSKGDEWFRTGDLIVMDEYGCVPYS